MEADSSRMDNLRITKVQGVRLDIRRRRYAGTLHLLAHHLLFCANDTENEVWIPYSTISRLDLYPPNPMTKDVIRSAIHITCRHFMFVRVHIPTTHCGDVWTSLKGMLNVYGVEGLEAFSYQPVWKNGSEDARRRSVARTATGVKGKGWLLYDAEREFARMGVDGEIWRLSGCNHEYEVCPTYPRHLVIPSKISDNVLRYTSRFRSKGRIPVLSYLHKNGISITRSSQPLVGLTLNRSIQDEKLVEAIFTSTGTYPVEPCLIIDARPTANAMAQTAMGAGTESMEHYRSAKLEYLGIDNIHVVRESWGRLMEAYNGGEGGPIPRAALEKSRWLRHIKHILDGTLLIVNHVHIKKSHVLVHCSDGWDRTTQLCSLSALCLDPYYRTLAGFCTLISKDWLSFGHKFSDRCGHVSRPEDTERSYASQWRDVRKSLVGGVKGFIKSVRDGGAEGMFGIDSGMTSEPAFPPVSSASGNPSIPPRAGGGSNNGSSGGGGGEVLESVTPSYKSPRELSPVFSQFLDCVYQLWVQYPTRFAFSVELLAFLNQSVYECRYGDFLFNCEREREAADVTRRCWSVWDAVLGDDEAAEGGNSSQKKFVNPNHVNDDEEVLFPSTKDLRYWIAICMQEDAASSSGSVSCSSADSEEDGSGVAAPIHLTHDEDDTDDKAVFLDDDGISDDDDEKPVVIGSPNTAHAVMYPPPPTFSNAARPVSPLDRPSRAGGIHTNHTSRSRSASKDRSPGIPIPSPPTPTKHKHLQPFRHQQDHTLKPNVQPTLTAQHDTTASTVQDSDRAFERFTIGDDDDDDNNDKTTMKPLSHNTNGSAATTNGGNGTTPAGASEAVVVKCDWEGGHPLS
ncbi:protein-tyrosine phosphatase-like protein [Gaertneriomyces semiglobifer]|nr:protein-tyrosine phosphatase-like protein [Gaertneriomyces semiglobifer]